MKAANMTSNRQMLFSMTGIGTVCALLIALTFEGTKPRIERLKKIALEEAIYQVIPDVSTMVAYDFTDGELVQSVAQPSLYAGYSENGELKGFAIAASGMGYADKIRILYGYDPFAEAVTGLHILESKETPGLGDKIGKDPEFLKNFISLDATLNADQTVLVNEIKAVKYGQKEQAWEIDGITGATISSRAIGDIIQSSGSELFPVIQENLDKFLKE